VFIGTQKLVSLQAHTRPSVQAELDLRTSRSSSIGPVQTVRHTHTKSHKLICPGHGAPQSMAYSFTSVGNFFVYVRGTPLLYEKSNNAKCGVTRVRHSLNNVCILFDSRPHTLVAEGLGH
jgi:hypothetical protein